MTSNVQNSLVENFLILHLRAPMMSFGSVTVDSFSPTDDFPGLSMITGMFANALGYTHEDRLSTQEMQDNMHLGSSIIQEGRILIDMQNADIYLSDIAWTTKDFGPVKRGNKSSSGGKSTDRRERHYLSDTYAVCAVTFKKGYKGVDINQIKDALNYPKRPVFFGRKNCIPSVQIVDANPFQLAKNSYDALQKRFGVGLRSQWSIDSGPIDGPAVYQITSARDIKNWSEDQHVGMRRVVEGDT
jgi:CRISPR system Cascade subunit CasD